MFKFIVLNDNDNTYTLCQNEREVKDTIPGLIDDDGIDPTYLEIYPFDGQTVIEFEREVVIKTKTSISLSKG